MSQSPERQPEVQKGPFPREFVEILQKKQGEKVTRFSLVGLGIYFSILDNIPHSVWEVFIRKVDADHAVFEIKVEKNDQTSAVHTFRFGFKNQTLEATEVVLQESGEDDMSFEEVLEELQIDEEELKRLISNAELRGFRTKGGMAFKRKDVVNLKNGTTHEPTIILTDSDQEFGSPQEYSDAENDDDFSRTLEERKARIQNLIDIMPDQGVVTRDTLLDLFTNRVLPAHISCGIVMNGQLFVGAIELDDTAPVYVYDPETADLVCLPPPQRKHLKSSGSLPIIALALTIGVTIGAVFRERIPLLRQWVPGASPSETDRQAREAECSAIAAQAHGFLNPQNLTLEQCDAALRQWEQNQQHPERAKSIAQWRLVRNCVELDQNLQRKLQELMSTGSSVTLGEINELVNPNRFTEQQVQQALDQWNAPALAQHPDRDGSVREWTVHAELLRLQRMIQAFAQREFQVQ